METALAKEGTEKFTLRYSMLQGVVEQRTWLFNGEEIKNSSHYTVKERSLVILGLNRGDTGRYRVLLTNPFSRVEADINVTVLCKMNSFDLKHVSSASVLNVSVCIL